MKNIISKHSTPLSWVPSGFENYRDHYPATPTIPLLDLTYTKNFIAVWHELKETGIHPNNPLLKRLAIALQNTTLVLIRGFLGNYMPGNLVQIYKALRSLGIDTFIACNSARSTIAENAKYITAEIHRRVVPTRRLLFLAHSKGGLEAQWIISFNPCLLERTSGIIMSQTPLGPSIVLESLLLKQHQNSLIGIKRKWAEHLQRMGICLIRAHHTGEELTTKKLNSIIDLLQAKRNNNLLLQTASWSSRPTTWLDSFHQRLQEVRPNCAHDGQFYLEDLIWPNVPHVLLPHLDHAQPVVGGFGFDPALYWLTMILLYMNHLTS